MAVVMLPSRAREIAREIASGTPTASQVASGYDCSIGDVVVVCWIWIWIASLTAIGAIFVSLGIGFEIGSAKGISCLLVWATETWIGRHLLCRHLHLLRCAAGSRAQSDRARCTRSTSPRPSSAPCRGRARRRRHPGRHLDHESAGHAHLHYRPVLLPFPHGSLNHQFVSHPYP